MKTIIKACAALSLLAFLALGCSSPLADKSSTSKTASNDSGDKISLSISVAWPDYAALAAAAAKGRALGASSRVVDPAAIYFDLYLRPVTPQMIEGSTGKARGAIEVLGSEYLVGRVDLSQAVVTPGADGLTRTVTASFQVLPATYSTAYFEMRAADETVLTSGGLYRGELWDGVVSSTQNTIAMVGRVASTNPKLISAGPEIDSWTAYGFASINSVAPGELRYYALTFPPGSNYQISCIDGEAAGQSIVSVLYDPSGKKHAGNYYALAYNANDATHYYQGIIKADYPGGSTPIIAVYNAGTTTTSLVLGAIPEFASDGTVQTIDYTGYYGMMGRTICFPVEGGKPYTVALASQADTVLTTYIFFDAGDSVGNTTMPTGSGNSQVITPPAGATKMYFYTEFFTGGTMTGTYSVQPRAWLDIAVE